MLDASAVARPLAAFGGSGAIYAPGSPRSPLSAEQVAAATLEQLAQHYAPIYVQGHEPAKAGKYAWPVEDDSIGRAYLIRRPNGKLATQIDTGRPTVYAFAEKRRLGDREHVQLTYTVWYPRHPRTKKVDIEAADIDSGVLRLTLDGQNRPLFYETVLACGCYHKVFVESVVEAEARRVYGQPVKGKKFAVEKPASMALDWEVAGEVRTPPDGPCAPVVFVSGGEHRVVGLQSSAGFRWPDPARTVWPYRLAGYRELMAAPVDDGAETAPIFNSNDDQQVWGADRMERFIFMWIGTNDAGHPRRDDQILLHFDQSKWRNPQNYQRYLRLPPGTL
ncbi:MAG TPA: hypothetical protein VMV69_09615 [Pirellulales bacterium]|nr:hypothetical protein [Pirellulales bacterium]